MYFDVKIPQLSESGLKSRLSASGAELQPFEWKWTPIFDPFFMFPGPYLRLFSSYICQNFTRWSTILGDHAVKILADYLQVGLSYNHLSENGPQFSTLFFMFPAKYLRLFSSYICQNFTRWSTILGDQCIKILADYLQQGLRYLHFSDAGPKILRGFCS